MGAIEERIAETEAEAVALERNGEYAQAFTVLHRAYRAERKLREAQTLGLHISGATPWEAQQRDALLAEARAIVEGRG